ncbi:family UPF0390 [Cordyceps militaris]|uniref:Family UPF0390 n=1 Tax=Cordyceps militaris TaxID=73501 RepID=A0A2H4SQI1_CORMI|nr:family UPF0390 [Cordyceps militaris]
MSGKPKAAKVVHTKRQASKITKAGNKQAKDTLNKKFTSGLIGKTEAMLGERAGHLELIGKGKKGKKLTVKGGSKRFG